MGHTLKASGLIPFAICILLAPFILHINESAFAEDQTEKILRDLPGNISPVPPMEEDKSPTPAPAEPALAPMETDQTKVDENMTQLQDSNPDKTGSTPDMEKSAADQLQYPGVINRSIVRKPADAPSLEIYYPVFGQPKVDEALRKFAEKQADEYEKDVADALTPGEERPAAYEQWEMTGYFTLERPNPDIVSVIFNIFSYSGGAHGNLVITCLNYNLRTGQQIEFADLFKDPEKALEMMSSFSAEKLATELGEYADEDMIHSGTEPDLSNFSNLTLFPNGLYIEFQPYQVGPWAAGPQRVEMTLQDLAAAGPEPAIWPQAADIPAPPAPEQQPASPSTITTE